MAATTRTWSDYTIGVICALERERVAVEAMLDDIHNGVRPLANDDNSYTFGEIEHPHFGKHLVVIASLGPGIHGVVSATSVAATFKGMRYCFLVGIGAGFPQKEVRLGDVVVSVAKQGHPAVVDYLSGRTDNDCAFRIESYLAPPHTSLLKAVGGLSADHARNGPTYLTHLAKMLKNENYNDTNNGKRNYTFPKEPDNAYKQKPLKEYKRMPDGLEAPFIRKRGDDDYLDYPVIHFGAIASANILVKSASTRDLIFQRIKEQERVEALCLEMEAAGVLHAWPSCLVIRGICDYADSNKNDVWQNFAAAAAAAYMKDLLRRIVPRDVETITVLGNMVPLETSLQTLLQRMTDTRLQQADRYWMYMTQEGLMLYQQIWLLIHQEKTYLSYRYVSTLLGDVKQFWKRLSPELHDLGSSFFMAVLYMMHLERSEYGAQAAAQYRHLPALIDRFGSMARWTHCPDDCGALWNFVSFDYGFCRRDKQEKLKLQEQNMTARCRKLKEKQQG